MQLHFKQGHDLIFIDKPMGLSTHATDPGKPGICELYEKQIGSKLFVVHRLDKTTSGAMVFATSTEKAQKLSEDFKNRKIRKKYLFLTDRTSQEESYSLFSKIEKVGKISTSIVCSQDQANAITHFQRVKRSPFFELWQAEPVTGKTHQIRLHAQNIGLSILGDEIYGGSPFPELCLHALELQIPGEELWQCPPPRYFERLGLLKDQELVKWLSQIDRRQRMFDFLSQPKQCLRLIHTPEFRLDLLGSQAWAYWYKDTLPLKTDLLRFETLGNILGRQWIFRYMQDRGQDPNHKSVWTSEDFQPQWTAQEYNIKFKMREDSGQSPGLFLDQSEHRHEVQKTAAGKKVLNLFSYTCGFSVAAALGGAEQVTSVDASANFLSWGKDNFVLNGLPIENHEFFTQDVLLFMAGAKKRQRKFDLIVCDPPSFGRFKKQVFKLEKDLPELLNLCWSCLSPGPGSRLLFSCNLEKWSQEDLLRKIQQILPLAKISANSPGLDYELPTQGALMKSFWISRKS